MQAYGLPCSFSTEQEVRAKTARKAAPVAVEVNSEGVIQLDGIATRGMLMTGGPSVANRTVTFARSDAAIATSLTPAQLVDGILILANGALPMLVNLPSVTALNAFVNTNLVTQAPALVATTNDVAVRTTFKLTVITNARVDFAPPVAQPPGHTAPRSGYSRLAVPANPGDLTITSIDSGAFTQDVISLSVNVPRMAVDVYFIQITGTSADPEWLIMTNL